MYPWKSCRKHKSKPVICDKWFVQDFVNLINSPFLFIVFFSLSKVQNETNPIEKKKDGFIDFFPSIVWDNKSGNEKYTYENAYDC